MSTDIYFIYVVVVKKSAGYLKAQRIVRQLRGDSYSMTGLQTETDYRFKMNHRRLFDRNSFKLKKIDDEVTLIIGKRKWGNQGLCPMDVTTDPSANELETPALESV